MDFISTFKELQYDSETGELVVREGKDCRCIGLTTTLEAPELFHVIKLPRPVDIMITQVYEYSYGPANKPKLIIPEKIHYTGNSVEITFGEKISSIVRFNIMYVCGYEYGGV